MDSTYYIQRQTSTPITKAASRDSERTIPPPVLSIFPRRRRLCKQERQQDWLRLTLRNILSNTPSTHFAMSSCDEHPPTTSSKRDNNEETSSPTTATTTAATTTAATASEDPPPTKRTKKEEFLKFEGHRHPRVGDDFQATLLPEPHSRGDDDNGNHVGEGFELNGETPIVEVETTSEEEPGTNDEQ